LPHILITLTLLKGISKGSIGVITDILDRRLFQQYLVDAAATIDQNRLAWLQNNQRDIRADLYRGIDDHRCGWGPGRRIILPSSHTGSQRNMHAAYMDAMAIIGRFRKPHLFLTMTANPAIRRD